MLYLLCGLKKVMDFKTSINLIYCHATHLLFIFDEIIWICLIGAFARPEWHQFANLQVFACICISLYFHFIVFVYGFV